MDICSTETSQEKDFAVVIGIDAYPLFPEANLNGACDDAKRFCDWLRNFARLPEANIQLVCTVKDSSDPLPQQQQIDEAFVKVFEQAASQGGARRLYVYFAGHGTSMEQRHVALLTAGISPQYMNRSLDTTQYHDGLSRRTLFPQQFLFYDCCRNYDWKVRGRGPDWSAADPDTVDLEVEQWIFYAAGFTQYANTREWKLTTRRGLFTEALLEGVGGYAAHKVPHGGKVTMLGLGNYIKARLEELTREHHTGKQFLSWNPVGLFGDPILVTTTRPAYARVEFHVPPSIQEILVQDDRCFRLPSPVLKEGIGIMKLVWGRYCFEVQPNPTSKVPLILTLLSERTYQITWSDTGEPTVTIFRNPGGEVNQSLSSSEACPQDRHETTDTLDFMRNVVMEKTEETSPALRLNSE